VFRPHSLTGFAIKAAGAVIGLALVWSFISPWYNRLLVAASNGLSLAPFHLTTAGGDIYFADDFGQLVTGLHGAALNFGLILLLALLIATPGLGVVRRLRHIGLGLVAIFAVQLATLAALGGLVQAGAGASSASLTGVPVVLLCTIGFNLFPALIWLGLCLRQRPWQARPVQQPAAAASPERP